MAMKGFCLNKCFAIFRFREQNPVMQAYLVIYDRLKQRKAELYRGGFQWHVSLSIPRIWLPRLTIFTATSSGWETPYIAGQVSRDLEGKTAYVGDVGGQVRQV